MNSPKQLSQSDAYHKLKLLSRPDTIKKYDQGYVVGFIHPRSEQVIFLASIADVSQICYAKEPQLPGTLNIKQAKVYQNLDAAKNDIYLLRYHHRQFLNIITVAKPVMHFHAELEIPDSNHFPAPVLYTLAELAQNGSSDTFES